MLRKSAFSTEKAHTESYPRRNSEPGPAILKSSLGKLKALFVILCLLRILGRCAAVLKSMAKSPGEREAE